MRKSQAFWIVPGGIVVKNRVICTWYTHKGVLDFSNKVVQEILATRFGKDAAGVLLGEIRQEYKAVLPKIPQDWDLTSAGYYLSLYRVLAQHGAAFEIVSEIINESAEALTDCYFLRSRMSPCPC